MHRTLTTLYLKHIAQNVSAILFQCRCSISVCVLYLHRRTCDSQMCTYGWAREQKHKGYGELIKSGYAIRTHRLTQSIVARRTEQDVRTADTVAVHSADCRIGCVTAIVVLQPLNLHVPGQQAQLADAFLRQMQHGHYLHTKQTQDETNRVTMLCFIETCGKFRENYGGLIGKEESTRKSIQNI